MWRWIGELFQTQQLTLSRVAYKEVKDKYSDISNWLTKHDVHILEMSDEIFLKAFHIKKLLGITRRKVWRRSWGE